MRHINKFELEQAEEIFICASNKEILPVVQIDDTIIGSGKPGNKTKDIMNMFKKYTDSYSKKINDNVIHKSM